MDTTFATAPSPIWPTETNIVHIPGTAVTLSKQSLLLKTICRDGFDNIRKELLFVCAFHRPESIPAMVRMCLNQAIRDRTTQDGQYNASVACVHQRFLSDVDYETKLTRLVSNLMSSTWKHD